MSCSRIESLLDGYVDDELRNDERLEVEEHLAGCAECRRTLDELRALGHAVGALPREIAPGRDLLPDIRAAVGRATSPAPGRSWTRWAGIAASLALAGLLGLVGSDLWRRSGGENSATVVPAARPAVGTALGEFRAAEQQYLEATALLLAAVDERRGEIAPETRAVLEENLRIIDEAIAEVRDALEADPGNPRNGHSLTALHRQKIELLRTASRLAS